MATVSWSTPGSADTLITGTDLNSLADGQGVVGPEIDNSSDKKLYMDVDVVLNASTGSGTDAYIGLYLISAPDGTNYPNPPGTTVGNGEQVPPNYWVASLLGVDQGGTARAITRAVAREIRIPPTKFRLVLVNNLGAALPASGNTVSGYRYGETVA